MRGSIAGWSLGGSEDLEHGGLNLVLPVDSAVALRLSTFVSCSSSRPTDPVCLSNRSQFLRRWKSCTVFGGACLIIRAANTSTLNENTQSNTGAESGEMNRKSRSSQYWIFPWLLISTKHNTWRSFHLNNTVDNNCEQMRRRSLQTQVAFIRGKRRLQRRNSWCSST